MSGPKVACVLMAAVLSGSLGCAATGLADSGCRDERGFVTIFDGTSFDGWEIIIEKGKELKADAFYLEDKTLACTGYGYHWFRYTEPL